MAQASDTMPANLDGLDTGLAVLECLAPDRSLSLGEISATLSLTKSRTFRILTTLKQRGFVEQAVRGGPYRFGDKVWEMANGFLLFRTLPRVARPIMEELSGSVRGTIVLRALEGAEQLTLECIHSPNVLRTSFPVGAHYPPTYGSTGKALLAFSPKPVTDRLLSHLSGSEASKLLNELRLTRKRGYALNFEESVRGVHGIAGPIRDGEGRAVAAIGISFPASDLPRTRVPEVAKALSAACATISGRCGYTRAHDA